MANAVNLRKPPSALPEKVKAKRKQTRLYNKIVRIQDKPPIYPHEFWFVYHYLHDMEWCHCVPLQQNGVFTGLKRYGRPRFKLVPEGECREIDVPASRCKLVKAVMVAHTNNADQEVWDIQDDELLSMGMHTSTQSLERDQRRLSRSVDHEAHKPHLLNEIALQSGPSEKSSSASFASSWTTIC